MSIGGGLFDRQPCPRCGESRLHGKLTKHCENPRCDWLTCRSCRLVVSERTGRRFDDPSQEQEET